MVKRQYMPIKIIRIVTLLVSILLLIYGAVICRNILKDIPDKIVTIDEYEVDLDDKEAEFLFTSPKNGIINFKEINVSVGSIPYILFLLFFSFQTVKMILILTKDIGILYENQNLLRRNLILSIKSILMTACILSVYFIVLKNIKIPNSLLPADHIFNISHYKRLINDLDQLTRSYGDKFLPMKDIMDQLSVIWKIMILMIVLGIVNTVTFMIEGLLKGGAIKNYI